MAKESEAIYWRWSVTSSKNISISVLSVTEASQAHIKTQSQIPPINVLMPHLILQEGKDDDNPDGREAAVCCP
jgi:hypothetical protein